MEIVKHPHAVEIKDGSFEITFWAEGDYSEIIISGIGYDEVIFGGIPATLMNKLQDAIVEWKKEQS
jgi:hypothetical protein